MASSSGVSWPASSAAASSGGARIAFEHRGVHHEVQVVRPVQRVEVQRALAFDETPIHLYRRSDSTPPSRGSHRTARRCGWACAAGGPRRAPGSRSRSAAGSASCGLRRHLHRVQVEVQDAGMFATGGGGQRVVEDPLGLHHPRAGRGLAGSGVPQRPCGHVDQRVGGQRLHVDVVGIGLGQRRHRVGVGGVSGLQRVGVVRVVGGEAGLSAPRSARVRPPTPDPWPPGRVPSARGPTTPPGRPGRTPPMPCCSSVRSHTRCPIARSRGRGRAPMHDRSSGSPLRG